MPENKNVSYVRKMQIFCKNENNLKPLLCLIATSLIKRESTRIDIINNDNFCDRRVRSNSIIAAIARYA